jgi:lysozyme
MGASMTTLRGVDISSYQSAIPTGADFVVLKATEGLKFNDSRFVGWWNTLRGKPRGAYHFGHPSNSAVQEADHFLSVVSGRLMPGDVIVLDHEVNDGKSAAHCAQWAKDWCARVKQKTGITPVIYTYLAFAWAGNCDGLGGYPLWIADPSSAAGHPRVPSPWKSWVLHQYTSAGGIDRDVFNGNATDWRALGGSHTQQQEEDMAVVESLGAGSGQQIPAKGFAAIKFTKVYSDNHKLNKGDKLVFNGSYWAVMSAVFELHGFQPGDMVDVAWTRLKSDGKTFNDDAWRLHYQADKNGVVRNEIGGQAGMYASDPLQLRVYNDNAYSLTVQGLMAKVALLKMA